jgi:choice-of-anchor B domain-containing protein
MRADMLSAQSFYEDEPLARLQFGYSVELVGDRLFVGEPERVMSPPAISVYALEEDSWGLLAELRSPSELRRNGFGQLIAADARILVASALGEDGGARVHVFEEIEGGEWVEMTALQDPRGADSQVGFGQALAVEGEWMAVGAPGADGRRGAVHVYRRDELGWSEHVVLTPPDDLVDLLFGWSVKVDGARVVVGAPLFEDATGAAFVFELLEEGASVGTLLRPEDVGPDAVLGYKVDLDGPNLAVSAPNRDGSSGTVHLFRIDAASGDWNWDAGLTSPEGAPRNSFAFDLALDGDGIWIGDPSSDRGVGAAFVYGRSPGDSLTWAETGHLAAPGGVRGTGFAASLSVSGAWAGIGAFQARQSTGAVNVYRRTEEGWVEHSVLAAEIEALPSMKGEPVRCLDGAAGGFECSDVDVVSFLSLPELGGGPGIQVNDLWVWSDEELGRDYALVGRTDGTSFVDVTDPSQPVWVGEMLRTDGTPITKWRDVKVHAGHAFVVSDGSPGHGVQILDLTRLREFDGEPLLLEPDATFEGVSSAHNLFINEETGFAYVVGSRGGRDCGPGLLILDVADPKNPVLAGCFVDTLTGRQSDGYSHDVQCVLYHGPDDAYQDREICFGSNETALSIADVTDKAEPIAVSRASYPGVAYAHQGWLTEDHRYFFLGDELDEPNDPDPRTRTLVWDVTSLEDPILLTEYRSPASATDHNLYIRGDLMYQANYEAGLRLVDISDPGNPVEVGYFDTVPYREDSFQMDGAWTAYPFLGNGLILVSSQWEGLFILKRSEPIT